MLGYLEKKKQYLPLVAVLTVGLAAALASFVIIDRFDYQRIHESFERKADERYAAFKREIESDLQVLESIRTYYAASREFRRSEIWILANPFLLRHPSIQALEWIPRITDSQRATYEAKAKEEGFRDFQISDRTAQGAKVESPRRSEYYPVYFIEPYKGNEIALGFDLASNATRKESLERARDTGQLVATKRIKLVQETTGRFGFLVFAPVYGKDSRTDTIPERRKNLRGFALGVFRISDILDKSYTYLEPENINTYLYEAPVPDNDHLLYFHPSRSQAQGGNQKSEPGGKFEYRKSLNIAGQEWLMIFETGPHYIAKEKSPWSWIVLIFVLLLTGLSFLYMVANLRYAGKLSIANEELEARIKERTEDLARVNELLQKDIDDRKLAEDALRESEERYRIVVENASDAVFRTDNNGIFTFVNPAMVRISGYEEAEIIGKHYLLFIHPGMRDGASKFFGRQFVKRIQNTYFEYSIITKGGHEVWIGQNTQLLMDGRHITGFQAVARDITERKRAEDALQKSEERYRSIFENAMEGIFQSTPDGRFISVNPAMAKTCGFASPEEMVSSIHDIAKDHYVMQEDRERFKKLLKEYGRVENLEHRLYKEDGSIVWVSVNARAVRDEHGNAIYYEGTNQDITERKRIEEELRSKNKQLSEISSRLPSLVFQFHARQDGSRAVSYVTGQVNRLFGLDPEPQGFFERFTEAILPEQREDFLKNVEKTISEAAEWNYEGAIRKPSGEIMWIAGIASPTKKTDEIVYDGVILDITDRKRAEDEKRSLTERLQRAEKMEALGTLAGGVAHDLNNVLGIVVGYAEMLLMDADKSSSIRSDLQNIMSGGQRAAAIVQDLLTLARRGVSGRKVLNLNKIIADTQKSPEFDNLSSYHPSIKIRTELEPDLLNVSGSSVHLGKTLFNLVSNASEAMPNGGIVTIKTANQYLEKPIHRYDEVLEGDYVVLSVSDTGEGISANDLERIFEPFYTKKVMGRSGTGLGLAVVWGTVKDHNGYINVESEEGKGSTFTLYFPASREDISSEADAVSISKYIGKGESILIVDDVKGQRDLAATILQKLNYSVATVTSGEEAVAYLKEHNVNLVVLDMIMDPGMDGLDTYRSILEIHQQQKAIIVSGFSETDRVSTAQALGAGAYVRKPYVIEKLGLAVKNELDRK
jgi:PAS domain S-box-containing protein